MTHTPTPDIADSERPTVDFGKIGRELKIAANVVENVVRLLDDGNTIPFVTRFRKDLTEGLNEKQILEIKRLVALHRALAERKVFVLKSIESQGALTEPVKLQIATASNLRALEDAYAPYKPQKQSRALVAKQQGLEPLMEEILGATSSDIDLASRATHFVRVDRGLSSVDDVIRGVSDLLIEKFSANPELKNQLRQIVKKTGMIVSKAVEPAEPKSVPVVVTKDDSETNTVAVGVETATSGETPTQASIAPQLSSGEASELELESTTPQVQPEESVQPSDTSPASTSIVPERSINAEFPTQEVNVAENQTPGSGKPKKKKKKKAGPDPFKDYKDFKQSLKKLGHHQYLAMNRGERADKIKLKLQADDAQIQEAAVALLVPPEHPFAEFFKKCAQDALSKVLMPSIEREIRRELTEAAESHATEVFANNLRSLLLQPPLRNGRVLAIDPGFKSGCGLVVLDEFGSVLAHDQIYVVGNQAKRDSSKAKIIEWVHRHDIRVIAIGTGAACRQAEQMVSDLIAEKFADNKIRYVMVNEAGASVYSISEIGREELTELPAAIRSAVSIGRRLQDPLSEFTKISPANIGIGMYQHDVKAKHLVESLNDIVESCVNQVGVNVNTASVSLLKYVSGLNALAARRLIEHRQKIGGFKNRQQLKEVSGIGEATFVQAAGFLRIFDGENPLDSTGIHPESYPLAEEIIKLAQTSLEELFPKITIRHHDEIEPFQPAVVENIVEESPVSTDAASMSAAVDAEKETTESDSNQLSDSNASSDSSLTAASSHDHGSRVEPVVDEENSRNLEARKQAVQRLSQLDIDAIAKANGAGRMQVRDIILALKKPAWDPRDRVAKPVFRRGILKLADLKPEMQLDGQIVNVVDFGVFVDIGLGESSLVHVSQLSHRYVADPHRLFSVGNILRVWVAEIDSSRRRVKLTAIQPGSKAPESKHRGKFKKPETTAPSAESKPVEQTERTSRSFSDRSKSSFKSGVPGRQGGQGGQEGRQRFDSREKRFEPQKSKGRFEGGRAKSGQTPPPKKPKPSQPAPPITDGMLKGNEPMRSFSDLLQFVQKKPKQGDEKA